MSAIALIVNRKGKPVQPGAIDTVLARMNPRGIDGANCWQHKNYGLGQQNFLVHPEDIICPLSIAVVDGTISIVFDGRLDNCTDLINDIGFFPRDSHSDAELAIAAYRHWGVQCLGRLRGSFALILVDTSKSKVLLYRNPLGGRELYYHISPKHILAATEPAALLAHPAVHDDTDALWITDYFANFLPASEHTVYATIKQLLPGECLEWQPDKVKLFREHPSIGRKTIRFATDHRLRGSFQENF